MKRASALFLISVSLFAQKNRTGEWAPIVNWPFIPVSVGQMPDGRIIGWASTRPTTFPAGETYTYAAIFDPATGTFTNLPNVKHDMFCAGIASTADGRIVASGGGADVRTTSFLSMTGSQNWVQLGNMAQGRWYNSSLTLPDGRILTWWGRGANGIAEILDPATGRWTTFNNLNAASSADPNDGVDDENQWFPHLHVAPNGKVFHAGPLKTLRWLDVTGAGSIQAAGTRTPDGDRHRKLGFSVMYRPGRILFTGGRDDRYTPRVTNSAVRLDVTGATPVVTPAAPMNYARVFHYNVVLPNGEVMAVLGNTSGTKFSDDGGVLVPEIWNPDTNTWRTVASQTQPRGYHGTALLLRDGRVWVGGGGLCGCGADHQNGQIFSPGYLFNADGTAASRPTIASATYELKAGQTFPVTGSDDITSFALVRLQGTTHGINSDQRYIPVSFSKTGPGQYSLTTDANANVLIPGMYWLFALNANGTPSLGYHVQVYTPAAWPGAGNVTQNLARGKTATQSSTFQTAAAARAVDGNQNGSFDQNSVSHTNADAQAWWQVDLGAISDLREIRVWNRSDCCADRLANFHVFVSDVPFTSNVLSAVKTQAGVLDLAFPGTAGPTTVFSLNRTGRYVRVQLEGTGNLQLAEVEVFGRVIPNRAPTASLTAPASGATFTAPATVSLTASATDPDNNIVRVEFFNGSTKLGEDTTAPYAFSWTNVAVGTYSLTARVTDAGGLSATSSAVSITVNAANRAPSVSLTAPANNASFAAGATIGLTANATDPDNNITRVEFFAGATKLGEDALAPYSFSWANVPAGAYSLTARVTDAGGLSATSAAININVTAANAAPGVTLTAPANNASFTAPAGITLTASATDPENAITRVEFFNGSTKLGEDTTAPYAFSWTNVPAGAYSLTARVTDAGGLSATSAAVNVTVTAAGSSGLTGDYYDSRDFTNLRFSRTDATVDFNWGSASPGTGVTANAFSVRWSGRIKAPASTEVTFCATANDGMLVKINNSVIVDNYYTRASAGTSCGVVAMTQNTLYDIAIDYYNDGTGSQAQLRWWYPGGNFEVVPSSALTPRGGSPAAPPSVAITSPANAASFNAPASIAIAANASDSDGTVARVEFFNGSTKLGEDTTAPYSFTWANVPAGLYQIVVRATDNAGLSASASVNVTVTNPSGVGSGLKGEYFANLDYTGLQLTRTDAKIDFDWGTAGPGSGLNGAQYAVRWTGQIEAPATEEFVFCGTSDNGIRVKIGNLVVVDGYYDHPLQTFCGVVNLTQGQKQPITVEYYNSGGSGAAKLEWWYPSGSFEVVPTARLFPQ